MHESKHYFSPEPFRRQASLTVIFLRYEVEKGLRAAYVTITQSFFSTKPLPAMVQIFTKMGPINAFICFILFLGLYSGFYGATSNWY